MKNLCYVICIILFTACSTTKSSLEPIQQTKSLVRDSTSDTMVSCEPADYHPSTTRKIDILHTKLEVHFDWNNLLLIGKATITLKPYFYSTKEITLDAVNQTIQSVSILTHTNNPLLFTNNKTQLNIQLDKVYTRNDTIKIQIEYTAKGYERKSNDDTGISTMDKGLYFVNPHGDDNNTPTEIWTQGEPDDNSCWFPTIDKPNERMTQEIYITIDAAHKDFVTLSNGLLVSSRKNSDGSRTDDWKQSLPAAPYLTMMAIGDFSIVHDKWKNMDVNYYVEKEYAPYAKAIFGNTPEMIEFFSNKLGTPYPWAKYSQVVVRNYASGAMENTTAVVHGAFLNQTDRELLDNNYEDVISHELFHHWFGDYVTCEQWSNITLNEGFASYGEYLWQEYKYGRDVADQHAYKAMQQYILSVEKGPKPLIRYEYNKPDDLFESANTYNKGSAVIQMIRKYVGDDAFFTALKMYLHTYQFSSVEADNLRLVFEKVTGEDLHWFFNEWFYAAGYPKLLIKHTYNDSLKKYTITIQQKQDLKEFPCFKLPIDIDIYMDGKKERKRFWVNHSLETFSFSAAHIPDLVNVDAEKSLICTKEEEKSIPEWIFQYKNSPLYVDRLEAIKGLEAFTSIPKVANTLLDALNDTSPDLRERIISLSGNLPPEYKGKVKEKLIQLAKNDNKTSVRALAIKQLADDYQEDNTLASLFLETIKDKSYLVEGASLIALTKINEQQGIQMAKEFETEKNLHLLFAVAKIYAIHGSDKNYAFFKSLSNKVQGWENIPFANLYTDFLERCSDDTIDTGVHILTNIAKNNGNQWVRNYGQKGIQNLADMFSDRAKEITKSIAAQKVMEPDPVKIKLLKEKLIKAKNQQHKLSALADSLKSRS